MTLYSPSQIADFFLSTIDTSKGDTISPLKLQKLVYYAQAWHYTLFGKPLFKEKIEAWVNGPVVPSLYSRFASTTKHRNIDISKIQLEKVKFPEQTNQLLNEIVLVYGERSGSYLEDLTHSEAPWIKARGTISPIVICKNEITLESMKDYYSTFKYEA